MSNQRELVYQMLERVGQYMENRDENADPVTVALSAIEEAALDSDPTPDSDSPRDAWWFRWLKFGAVIAFPAIVLGLGFLFADYIAQYRANSFHERAVTSRIVERDTIGSMKFRFWLGAAVGGGLGMIYVGRCVIRRTDP